MVILKSTAVLKCEGETLSSQASERHFVEI